MSAAFFKVAACKRVGKFAILRCKGKKISTKSKYWEEMQNLQCKDFESFVVCWCVHSALETVYYLQSSCSSGPGCSKPRFVFPWKSASLRFVMYSQSTLCRIYSEPEAFDPIEYTIVISRIDNFVAVFIARKGDETTTVGHWFCSKPQSAISELIFLRRWIKFNPPIRVRLVLIGVWETRSNRGLKFNRWFSCLILDER